MGLFDQVVGALAGGQSEGSNSQLIQSVFQIINSPQVGGLEGLVKALQQGGLSEAVSSWISTGQNMPVSADQIQSSLGGSLLDGLAQQTGMTQQQASGRLAELLPQIIDKLTPNGQLPQQGPSDLLAQGLDLLKKGGLFS